MNMNSSLSKTTFKRVSYKKLPLYSDPDMPPRERFRRYGRPQDCPDPELRRILTKLANNRSRRRLWLQRMEAEISGSRMAVFLTCTTGSPSPTLEEMARLRQLYFKRLRAQIQYLEKKMREAAIPFEPCTVRNFTVVDFNGQHGLRHLHSLVLLSKVVPIRLLKEPWHAIMRDYRRSFIGPIRPMKKKREAQVKAWSRLPVSQRTEENHMKIFQRDSKVRARAMQVHFKIMQRSEDLERLYAPKWFIREGTSKRVLNYVLSYIIDSREKNRQAEDGGIISSPRASVSQRPKFGTIFSPEFMVSSTPRFRNWLEKVDE